ncbi:MAG: hypothetical protein LC105_04460 [Chitinophagales bacterium]|nr:hypothetical protein [Chitinophagales bacterium]
MNNKPFILCVLFHVLFVFGMTEANGQSSYFKNAIKNGRSPDALYKVSIPNGKAVREENIRFFGPEYVIQNMNFHRVASFGDICEKCVQSFEFLPNEEIYEYLYEAKIKKSFIENTAISYKNLIAKPMGKGYIQFTEGSFFTDETVYWGGDLVNGKLNGTGVGMITRIESFLAGKPNSTTKVPGYTIIVFRGTFLNGIPDGNFKHYTLRLKITDGGIKNINSNLVESKGQYSLTGNNEGIATLYSEGKYYLIDRGTMRTINNSKDNSFKSVTEVFKNGKAIVVNNINEEIIINKSGVFVDYSPKQKQDFELARLEKERKEREEAERQRLLEIENQMIAEQQRQARIRAEAVRVEKIRGAEVGEKLLYSETWEYREGIWIFQTSGQYRMMVTCYIENIVKDRYQLRVGDVSSTNNSRYSTPTINGTKVSKGDIIWARPLEDNSWVYGE